MQELNTLYIRYLDCTSVSIDSRSVKPGAIFFGLRGLNHNGNEFAKHALNSGAKYAVIDDYNFQEDDRYILVEESLSSLQGLAKYHRQQLTIPVIAITGSAGKTTTKELIALVLASKYKVVSTSGNFNNLIGVPLTILSIEKNTDIAVVEMGANHVGEIAELCEIAMPTHGLITNIKPVHIEGFKNFEGVVKAKTELYAYLAQQNGVVFVNATEKILKEQSLKYFKNPILYQDQKCSEFCDMVDQDPFVVYHSPCGDLVHTNLLGGYHINNISAATCIGSHFGVEEELINSSMESYIPSNNRSQIIKSKTNLILLDAYNANVESMKGSIEALSRIEYPNKLLILGAMREMGEETENVHTELGRFLLQYPDYVILLCGESMKWAKKECPTAHLFFTRIELEAYIKKQSYKDTAILLKGARYWKLESLVEFI